MTRRDRLRDRPSKLPTADAPIPADPATWATCEQAVAILEAAVAAAERDGDENGASIARGQLDEARAELAAQPVEVFTFRCIPSKQWEELVDEHPPSDEQRKQGWQWDVEAFRPALLAACEVPAEDDEPLGVRGWVEVAEEGQMRPGELELLFATAAQLNARQPSVSLGKGFSRILS